MQRDVKLTLDEVKLIAGVANYAMAKLGKPPLSSVPPEDGRLRSVVEMRNLNTSASATWWPFPIRRSISRDDLSFLAPYIDDWIRGKAPPQNLPSEYEDWRPKTLAAFKERMQNEGLLPDDR